MSLIKFPKYSRRYTYTKNSLFQLISDFVLLGFCRHCFLRLDRSSSGFFDFDDLTPAAAFCLRLFFGTVKKRLMRFVGLEFRLLLGLDLECHLSVARLGHDQHILEPDHVDLIRLQTFLICYSTLHYKVLSRFSTKQSFPQFRLPKKRSKLREIAKKEEFPRELCLLFQMGLTLTLRIKSIYTLFQSIFLIRSRFCHKNSINF